MPMSKLLKSCGILLLIFIFASLSTNAQGTISLPKIGGENNTFNYSSNSAITQNQELSENSSSVDFYPYMRELVRRLILNWNPPRDKVLHNVVTFFTISKDGMITNIKILETSGSKTSDDAAIKAIQTTNPARPLPADFSGDHIDVSFTFPYGGNDYEDGGWYDRKAYQEWYNEHKKNKRK